jgi:hypothetical protein
MEADETLWPEQHGRGKEKQEAAAVQQPMNEARPGVSSFISNPLSYPFFCFAL